jgi:hypothetical protein
MPHGNAGATKPRLIIAVKGVPGLITLSVHDLYCIG